MTKFGRQCVYAIGILAVPGLLLTPQMVSDTTAVTSYLAKTLFANNLHEVTPGKFYRSAEMSRSALQTTLKDYRIKTVIDLRLNRDKPDSAGLTEAEVVRRGGAEYIHLPFRSSRAQLDQFAKLLTAFDTAQLPILVHCSSGTHRAGVAAALWLLEKEGKHFDEAMLQLTPRYGFFQFERDLKSFFQGAPTLDKIFARYRAETAGAETTGDGASKRKSLKNWIAEQLAHLKPEIEKPATLDE